jgi:hypothetical protein
MKFAKEYWSDITDFEGVYQVSNWGNVRRIKAGKGAQLRNKKPTVDTHGYAVVTLWQNNKQSRKYIHRLIAEAFVEGDTSLTIDHIDGNKLNNSLSNLEWVSKSENTKRQHQTGLASTETQFKSGWNSVL